MITILGMREPYSGNAIVINTCSNSKLNFNQQKQEMQMNQQDKLLMAKEKAIEFCNESIANIEIVKNKIQNDELVLNRLSEVLCHIPIDADLDYTDSDYE